MIRDSKISRRHSGKNLNFEETENLPVNVNHHLVDRMSIDSCSRPPLNTIREPTSKPDQESLGFKSSKLYRTPTKSKTRNQESGIPMRTPEKQVGLSRNRFGWGQDSIVNTPRSCKTLGRPSFGISEANSNSTHTTPTKSVSRPPNPSLRHPVTGGAKASSFTALSKGIPVICNTYTTVNTVEVPHFDLREDPSFWMDHNVQVLIRVRPLNGMEISSQGYSRCLKQDSAQCLTWVGHPETRFTFDHVACETIDQETLFKMVGLPMVENCLSGYNSCMFAYGQTGSGKTHTMLGEINDLEVKPSPYRGMTPRIFEFLFARIIAEEESRKDERLQYNCKCSFLEIYNEQITDLLDPSSTNLQLREDVKKGVYVENLTESEVHSVGDILKLLCQGSANRRVAATNMNRESSRSHSVFTCVIESRWEKDSTSNLRFARLNLVDLAGSERQKTSGAEGERLKEAANINKSLSTLGHVIMVLVDAVNSRTRHVPYRDSKLTFLLQDSLGGNSKTMIIANVSPSLSSATETLNTLKFAQRAKLIQNNAVINEDASGDVAALQHQIRLLKEELAILKRHNISRSLTFSSKDENYSNASSVEMNRLKVDNVLGDEDMILRVSCKQLKSLESSLNGALRREKSTESCIKQLEAEIEQLNCLVHQREEENRCTKMMLKFREDKIQRMEAVLAGSIAADSYLLEENNTLHEEIRILRAKVDRNPEVTRFAVENIRLLEQLKRFQDFYEEGEREKLLNEVSELRDQLVLFRDENNHMNPTKEAGKDKKEIDSLQSELKTCHEELERCRDDLSSCLERNAKLCREITDLKDLLETQKSATNDQGSGIEVIKESILELPSIGKQNDDNLSKDTEEVMDLQLEMEILKIILKEERFTRGETEEKFSSLTKQYENLREELLEDFRNTDKQQYDEMLHEKEIEIGSFQMHLHESMLKEKENHQEVTLLREKCKEKDRKFTILSQEFDLLTNKIEEVLTVGHNALDDALDMIGDGKRTRVVEQLQIIARRISEKELKIEELNSCLEDAKNRGNEMDSMLRSLRGATLVMSEAHQQDCIKKDEEILRLLSDLKEKDYIINQLEEQRELYELELMDAKLNTEKQAVESCCYVDKFVETQDKIKEADLMIKRLVSENEAMKIEISHKKQVINAKEIELFIILSKLEQVASEKNDIEKEITSLFTILEKFKEEIIILHVETELKDSISMVKKNVEVSILQKQVDVQEEALEMAQGRAKENEEITAKERLYELEFMDAKLNAAQQAVESFIYLDKFVQTQHNIKEADSMINKLMTENKALKMNVSRQNQVINDKDEELRFLYEKLVTAKEIESLIILSKLRQMASEFNNLEKEKISVHAVLEKFKEEIIVMHVDMKLKDLILMEKDAEVGLLKKQVNVQEEALMMAHAENEAIATEEKRLYELELTDAKLSAAQQSVESCCYLDKLVETRNNIKEADFAVKRLVNENKAMNIEIAAYINEKDALEKRHKTDNMELGSKIEELEHMILQIQAKLEQATLENNNLEKENVIISTVLEKFKEKIIISYVDLHLTDSVFLEKDAEVGVLQKQVEKHKEENGTLVVNIKEFESSYEALECGLYENIVKSLVLESRLTEIAQDALKAKESTEGRFKIHKEENETLVVIINDLKDDIKDYEASYEASECNLYENIVKSLVLESRLTEIAQDALKAKESTEGRLEIHKEENETLAVIINDLKDDIKEYEASYEASERKLNENIVKSQVREARLTENVQDALKAKELIEGRLEMVSLEYKTVLGEKINLIESLKGDMETVASERYDLQVELRRTKEELELAQAVAKENEAIAMNEKQECETSKRYAKVKEEELRLYEKSVEELEFTVNVLENQVDLVKGDAESQLSKRVELQEENDALKAQNDEMSGKLRREEVKARRVKEELASFRAASGERFS